MCMVHKARTRAEAFNFFLSEWSVRCVVCLNDLNKKDDSSSISYKIPITDLAGKTWLAFYPKIHLTQFFIRNILKTLLNQYVA
jgi:ribosomal protein S3AE